MRPIGMVLVALLLGAGPARAADFHVAADGSPAGDGSASAPWDLATALAQPAAVLPGDTLWLGGGTYGGSFASVLAGAAGQPITVRTPPGQWARVDLPTGGTDDAWQLNGAWVVYRDFEVFASGTDGARPNASVAGQHQTLVNLVVHDIGNTMLHGNGNEVVGCILYNNGVDGDTLAHQLYTQNDDPSAPTRIVDTLVFDSYAFGIHAYATHGYLLGIELVGNVWWNAGVAQTVGDRKDNCLVGGVDHPPQGIVLRENLGWAAQPTDRSVALGRYNDANQDVVLEDNYLVGATDFTNPWASVTMTGNTFVGPVTGAVAAADYPDNTYLAAAPTGAKVFVRPNPYDPGRAHVVVFNWDLADTVAVDPSGVLAPGAAYEVRNAQNFFAAPVASGTWDGTPLDLSMSAGDDPAPPIGPGLIEEGERTGKQFNVFVLLGGGSAPPVLDGGAGDGGAAHADGGAGDASPDGGAAAGGGGGCGCRHGAGPAGGAGVLAGAALALALATRRRRQGRA